MKFEDVEMISLEKSDRSFIYRMNGEDLPDQCPVGCKCTITNELTEPPAYCVNLGIDSTSGVIICRLDEENDPQNLLSMLGI